MAGCLFRQRIIADISRDLEQNPEKGAEDRAEYGQQHYHNIDDHNSPENLTYIFSVLTRVCLRVRAVCGFCGRDGFGRLRAGRICLIIGRMGVTGIVDVLAIVGVVAQFVSTFGAHKAVFVRFHLSEAYRTGIFIFFHTEILLRQGKL